MLLVLLKKIFFVMIRRFLLLLSIVAFCFQCVYGQISKGGTPPSILHNASLQEVEAQKVFPEDFDKILEEDAVDEKMGVMFRYGVLVPVDIDIYETGTWTVLPDGQRIWRQVITAPEALAVSLLFDKFYLPYGSELYVYNHTKDHIIGAFDHSNNHESFVFATELLRGETVVLEYVEPALREIDYLERRHNDANRNVSLKRGRLQLSVSDIIYAYRNVEFLYPDVYSGAKGCMVGVNCSPEGNNWQQQKRGVARVGVIFGSSAGWCSGSLVNNVAQDCKPYFLLADHCGGGASSTQMNQWVFYFNYEATAANCQSESGSTGQSMTGATLRARGMISGGSDFLLVELNQSVPASYNAYYNGWNRNNVTSSSGVSIHHPAGRVKKISTFSSPLQTTTWTGGGSGAHWAVQWIQTNNGHSVTAGGSSGSPLFDNNGRIVGTLTGGGSSCSNLTALDAYGKFSYHWESNGSTANRRLRPWLDPSNSVTVLNGTATCGTTPPGGLDCSNAISLNCGQTYNGTTVGQPSNVDLYNCVGWDQSGPERVHVITTTATGDITAALSNLSVDLDVFILSSCSENACLAYGDDVATLNNAPPGTYYIVVDGYMGAAGTYTLTVNCSGGTQPPAGCDTITNVGASENLTFYGFQSEWGYASGHNGYQMTRYADKYSNTGTRLLRHAWVPVAKAHNGSSSSNVVFRAWNGAGALPGAVLGSQTIPISSLDAGYWNLIDINPPISVTGNFFFGFEINYNHPQDTFAIFIAAHRPSGTNTAYVFESGSWKSFTDLYGGNLNTSLGLRPVICTTTEIMPTEKSGVIKVFPNPANTHIAVDWRDLGKIPDAIEIYDVMGRLVAILDINENSSNAVLNLDNFQTGLYFLNVTTNKYVHVKKFSVVK